MYFFSDTNLSNKAWNATVNDGIEELQLMEECNIMIYYYYYIIIIILLLLLFISLYFILLSFHLSSDPCEFSASSHHQRFLFSLHHHIIIHFSLLFHISLILHNPFEFQLTI